MSVTLRNAIITAHVSASRTQTVSTWPTGDTLDDDRVGYEYSGRGRADEASRASARTVDRQRRGEIRQQVGHGDVHRSQKLVIFRERPVRAAECRTLETAEQRHHIHTCMQIILSSQTT